MNGAVATTINTYDAFGQGAASNVGLFQFAGAPFLAPAGVLHLRARAYHPGLGRFVQADPILHAGSMNLYAYVGNDPVNATDPWGLQGDASRNPQEDITVIGPRQARWEYLERLTQQQDLREAQRPGGLSGGDRGGGEGVDPTLNGGDQPYIAFFVPEPPLEEATFDATMLALLPFMASGFAFRAVTRIYSAQVLNRMASERGPYHNFPGSYDRFIFAGQRTVVSPTYVTYTLRGTLNGVRGTYELGVRPSASGRNEVVTHRLFRPDR